MLYSTGKREAPTSTKEHNQTDLEKQSQRLEDGRRIIFYTFDDEKPQGNPPADEKDTNPSREKNQ